MSRSPREPSASESVVALPQRRPTARLAPSRRSLVLGFGIAALALVLYVGARETSVFAVRTIDVEGVDAPLARRVEAALRPVEGKSLLAVDGAQVAHLATALPDVASVSYDRSFPSTLHVHVEPEQGVAVLRRGAGAWLVSSSGRVMSSIPHGTHRDLPRIWLPKPAHVVLGEALDRGGGADEVLALTAVRGSALARQVSTVHVQRGQYVYNLHGGIELRVGAPTDLRLKLAIAERILARTTVRDYIDVSVVQRPVAGLEPQVSG